MPCVSRTRCSVLHGAPQSRDLRRCGALGGAAPPNDMSPACHFSETLFSVRFACASNREKFFEATRDFFDRAFEGWLQNEANVCRDSVNVWLRVPFAKLPVKSQTPVCRMLGVPTAERQADCIYRDMSRYDVLAGGLLSFGDLNEKNLPSRRTYPPSSAMLGAEASRSGRRCEWLPTMSSLSSHRRADDGRARQLHYSSRDHRTMGEEQVLAAEVNLRRQGQGY
jgi:hypothetical protein